MRIDYAVVMEDDKMLLYKMDHNENTIWDIPSINNEPEDSRDDALKKELKEALGIDAEIGERITEIKMWDSKKKENIFLTAYRVSSYFGEINFSPEWGETAWIEMEELTTLRHSYYSNLMAIELYNMYVEESIAGKELVETPGARIQKAIKVRGVTKNRLSELTGISRMGINDYCIGRYNPKPNKLLAIANALEVQLDYLLGLDVPICSQEQAEIIYNPYIEGKFDYQLLKHRIKLKYGTQTNFARVLNMTGQAVNNKVSGRSKLSREEMIKWATLLDINEAEIAHYFWGAPLDEGNPDNHRVDVLFEEKCDELENADKECAEPGFNLEDNESVRERIEEISSSIDELKEMMSDLKKSYEQSLGIMSYKMDALEMAQRKFLEELRNTK